MSDDSVEHFSVLVVGAGISGIGVAYHLAHRLAGKRFAVLESGETFGGTWTINRYPGARSDSDMYTFGYSFKPWVKDELATAEQIRAAVEQGKKIHVYADETRPFLQGSRLTAWELMKDGIPTTVISDNMAGAMMQQGKIGAIVVGADRIAANGDVANKIGTYTVAILAKEHAIPFYVAAPISTVDLACPDGSRIPIEQRNPREMTHIGGKQVVPDGVEVENPAFDVTPSKYVAAIITEKGIARAPYEDSLRRLAGLEAEVHP